MPTFRTVATGVCTLWACLAFALATSPAAAQSADKKAVAAALTLQGQGASAEHVALTAVEKHRQDAAQLMMKADFSVTEVAAGVEATGAPPWRRSPKHSGTPVCPSNSC